MTAALAAGCVCRRDTNLLMRLGYRLERGRMGRRGIAITSQELP